MLINLKQKSILVVLLMMLWSLLAGCSSYQTYDELDIEQRRTGDSTKIDRREAKYEKAVLFRDNKLNCLASQDHVWICTRMFSSGRARKTKSEVSIDSTIREYNRDRADGCGCVNSSELPRIFRELGL